MFLKRLPNTFFVLITSFLLCVCFATVSASRLCIETQRMTTYFQRAWLRRHLCQLKAVSTVPSCAGKTSHATPFSTITSAENAYVRELCIWHHHQPILCQNKAGSIFGWDQVNQTCHQPRTKWLWRTDTLTGCLADWLTDWQTDWLTDRLKESVNPPSMCVKHQSSVDVCKASILRRCV